MCHLDTITACAILVLTFSFTSFHRLTPINGALFLVNITTSSTNVRLFSPHGPPRFAENSIFSFWCIPLFATAAIPFMVPRPVFLPPSNNIDIRAYINYWRIKTVASLQSCTFQLLYFPSMMWPFCRRWVTATICIIRFCAALLECFITHCQKIG